MITRRRFIKTLVALSLMPKSALLAQDSTKTENFAIPKLETGIREGKDVYYDLTLQSGNSQILPNLNTPTWGINQAFLGTTLKANKGDNVHIKVKNSLNETSTVHWHGMKLPAEADGGPHQPIAAGESWLSEYKIIQPAATTWYHAHQIHKTGEHVYNGLAGMFIIDDNDSQNLNIPNEYGIDDIPVIIQDREFNVDGSFSYIRSRHDQMMGKSGNVILVNGVENAVLNAKKTLLRLRILNGSNARIYNLGFDDGRDFNIIATDGGLLEETIKSNSIILAPAERVEVLVDISDGKALSLINKVMTSSGQMAMNETSQEFEIFKIDASQAQSSMRTIPNSLVKHPEISKENANRRNFELQMTMGPQAMMGGNVFRINNKAMDMERIDEVVKAASTEIWVIENTSMMAHPFHVHNAQFKVISNSSGIQNHEKGFKDTVLVNPGSVVEILIEFPEYKNENVPYMYHCHILEHEDQGMMGQFTTV